MRGEQLRLFVTFTVVLVATLTDLLEPEPNPNRNPGRPPNRHARRYNSVRFSGPKSVALAPESHENTC